MGLDVSAVTSPIADRYRMETQTLSAREAVARVVQDWWGLGYGECKGGADAWDWSCEE